MTTATATKPRKPAAARKTAVKAPAFDHDAMLAERDEALDQVLREAADLPALTAALKRLLSARVQLSLQRRFDTVFTDFELRFEDRNCRADAYASLYVTLSFAPEPKAFPTWLSETDLFSELPRFSNYGSQYSMSLLKFDKVTGGFDLMVRNSVEGVTRFEMFELTVEQLHAAARAWDTTRGAMVAQEQARVSRASSPEAKTLKALADLEARHAELTQELADLDEQLSQARSKAYAVRESMARKVSATKPPLLQHLNGLRTQLGLKAV